MTVEHKRIDTILFDLDDTLINWAGQTQTLNQATQPHVDKMYDYLLGKGYSLPSRDVFLEAYYQAVRDHWDAARQTWSGLSFADVLRDLLGQFALPVAEIDITAVMRAYDWQPVPGVDLFADTLSVLQTLRQKGYKMGLITNSMMPMWMRDVEIETYGLRRFLDICVSSGDVGYIKPHPAIFHSTLAQLGSTPERAVFVGDRPANDIVGANEAGLTAVLIIPHNIHHELESARPDYTITCLSELLPILETFEQTR